MTETPTTPRRRTAEQRRRPDVTLLLAVLLPVVTVALLLVAGTEPTVRADRPPTTTPLTRTVLGCPTALPGATEVRVATGADASGSATVGSDDVDLTPERSAAVDSRKAAVVRAEDDLAPGLVAARSGTTPLAAVECPAPSAEQWFTGAGAGARHSSVLELVNATAGPAVADVEVYDGTGLVDAPDLRGVLVPGGETRRLVLAQLIPRTGDLALRVTTSRGRLTAAVEDTEDRLGSSTPTTDWLGSQAAPATTSTLLGIAGGAGRRTLVLANAGDDELRVTLKVVTADSVFAPKGLREVRVAPRSTARVRLTDELRAAVADGAYGLQVNATGPVTATLRSVVDDDLSVAAPVDVVTTRTVAVVPEGRKQLQLADASGVGVVTVVARDADGREVARERLQTTPGAGGVVDLPRSAVHLEVVPQRTSVRGAVLVTGTGAAVLRLTDLVTDGLVPQVGPGLP